MKSKAFNWKSGLLRLLILMVCFWVMHRCGLNPFWSVLAIIYWRTILRLVLVLGGIVWGLTALMY